MISDARGGHVSPGIYTEEKDVVYSAKSLGITSLGVVGEAVKGPAFQIVDVKDWNEYVDYFGGTMPEKYIGTDIPKYEMSYIAKEYLKESNNLHVCRVLGLSGFDAKRAYVVYGDFSGDTKPVVVLRSKQYEGQCEGETECEELKNTCWKEYVQNFEIVDYTGKIYDSKCMEISGITDEKYNKYMVLHVDSDDNETLYGRFGIKITWSDENGNSGESVYNVSLNKLDNDYIYNVLGTDPIKGSEKIYIEEVYDNAIANTIKKHNLQTDETMTDEKSIALMSTVVTSDEVSDYSMPFMPAMTPWFVSDVKGASETAINVRKLFRFITISDGNAANFQVKVSIERIDPSNGTFDVVVRDFYDTDGSKVVLEKFSNCTMVEGDKSYIGLKIGTADGLYEVKSRFIVVEVSTEDGISDSVPCGFVGYPMPKYGLGMIDINYRTKYEPLIKPKRQYFGMESKSIDTDVITFKGKYVAQSYEEGDTECMTAGFHMDSIFKANDTAVVYVDGETGYKFDSVEPVQDAIARNIPRINTKAYMANTIYDDINLRKFTAYFFGGFDGWNQYEKTRSNTNEFKANNYGVIPNVTIYQKINGEDGVAEYYNQKLDLKLPNTAITSDYYAYLGGYKQFANPNECSINVFATPGIDWYNNSLLVEEALDIVEDADDGRGGDAIYVVSSPYFNEELESTNDITVALDDTDIDSSYITTYYPWAKYFDTKSNVYLDMPVTRDAVRDMAYTDNKLYPWFSPAGTNRGNVDCVRASRRMTLSDEDELYNGRINPIKSFAKDGVKLWGNKTMYKKDTPLNRVNVRRLMIRVKELVINASKDLIFEQYDVALEKQFRGLVEPILSDVKSKRGIYDFKVVTECTPETRDQHILPARILIKPVSTLEYISISFVVYPESVEFSDEI